MSERGSGLGPFLMGIVLGAVAGVLFAPARGDLTRRRIGRQVGELRDLADEKLEHLAGPDEEEGESAEDASARDELEDRLRRARRRRRIERTARGRAPAPEEEDEPVA